MTDRAVRIGIDTGGTFTDVVVSDAGGLRSFKIPSTPDDPARSIRDAVLQVLGDSGATGLAELVHGTTVGTNTLLERTGARTAFVSTWGFEDTLAIARQARPRLYDLDVERPDPLVPPGLCFGVAERVGAGGEVLVELTRDAVAELAESIAASGAESVAVSLLFSFANPGHERAIELGLAPLGVPVTVSHRLLPEYREYERAATVAVNAYLVPRISAYLGRLAGHARETGIGTVRVMQSSGGSISLGTAAREPVRTILSGPAGGAVAARRLAAAAGLGDLITFDMGGTSTDVALVTRAGAMVTNEAVVAGVPVAVPVIDIHTVGAGGGSIAWVDAGGALRVGPGSAGADPGPACYGRDTRPTVTDANVVLGRLGRLLGGAMPLDAGRARCALDGLAEEISAASGRACDGVEAALGVVRVASASMERALRVVSVERGYDPRGAALLSFGGAGGLHAVDLACALAIPTVIVPVLPGAFSALGLLLGDVVRDVSRTVLGGAADEGRFEEVFEELERDARSALESEGVPAERIRVERRAALRYLGQSFELDVAWGGDAEALFHEEHRIRYGHADSTRFVETVHLRVRGIGAVDPVPLEMAGDETPRDAAPSSSVPVCFEDGWVETGVHDRESLSPGARVPGPALVLEYGSTTLVPPGWSARVDGFGNLVMSRLEEAS